MWRRSRGVTRRARVCAEAEGGEFESMTAAAGRKYLMRGGKTSLSASLAVRFAAAGHPTLVVSTDPAHSLSDSFAQELGGGRPMEVAEAAGALAAPLFALELDPEEAKQEFMAFASKDGGAPVNDFMDQMGLGAFTKQLAELQLGELLDTPPPGLDEAVAIAKVVQLMQQPEYAHFTRVVFDTAPTGHTLRMLSLPEFLEASLGKLVRLRQKLAGATSAIKGLFGQEGQDQNAAVEKLEKLQEQMKLVILLMMQRTMN